MSCQIDFSSVLAPLPHNCACFFCIVFNEFCIAFLMDNCPIKGYPKWSSVLYKQRTNGGRYPPFEIFAADLCLHTFWLAFGTLWHPFALLVHLWLHFHPLLFNSSHVKEKKFFDNSSKNLST